VDAEPIQDLTTRVLVLHDAERGTPEWLSQLTNALSQFGLEVGTRPRSRVSTVAGLVREFRFCVFVLVEHSADGSALRLAWHEAFAQLAASTQLLRVVDEYAIGDVLADAVLSDVERIASRVRRQRASTVSPAQSTMALRHDLEE
jgi:hypothetical protein